jgi:hypothetical protein
MSRLQSLIAHAPTGTRGTAMTDAGRAAFAGLGIALLAVIVAVAVLVGTTILQPSAGTAATSPAAEVDGWAPAVLAASQERTMSRAAATVDGWSSALLVSQPEVVDGWAARFLSGE